MTATTAQDRKTYELTDTGRQAAAEVAKDTPWAREEAFESTSHAAVPKAGLELAQAVAQISRTGTPEQKEQARALLDDTRRKIYAILAQS